MSAQKGTHNKSQRPAPLTHRAGRRKAGGPSLVSMAASLIAAILLCAAILLTTLSEAWFAPLAVALLLAGWLLLRRFGGEQIDRPDSPPASLPVRLVFLVVLSIAVLLIFLLKASSTTDKLAFAVVLAIAAIAAAWYEPAIRRFIASWRATWPVIVICSAVLGYCLLGDTLAARWSPIDDHDFMAALGPRGNCRLADIPARLMETEVGNFPVSERYRPSYYLARIFEACAWGLDAGAYWVEHLLIFIVGISLYWRFLARWLGLVGAGVLILYIMTWEFWTGIWCRLGPSEIYCFLGLAMYLVGLSGVVREYRAAPHRPTRRAIWYWALLTFGALLTIGAKESFVILLAPSLVLAVVLIVRRSLGLRGYICMALSTLLVAGMSALVAVPILNYLRQTGGVDFYRRNVQAAGMMSFIPKGLADSIAPLTWTFLLAGIAIAAVAIALLGPGRRLAAARWAIWPLVVVAGLVAVYASQVVFYKGDFPSLQFGRYNFPGLLARPLLVVAAAVYGLALLKRLGMDRRILRGFRAALIGGVLVLAIGKGYDPIIQTSKTEARQTAAWTAALNSALDEVRSEPARPILVTCYFPANNVEIVISIRRFLTANGVTNPMFLEDTDYQAIFAANKLKMDAMDEFYAAKLKGISAKGGEGYEPLGRMPKGLRPFGIGVSGPPSARSDPVDTRPLPKGRLF
ncbi:MAG: hypothetical protein ACE15C_13030 [Phycisphaerae bacterium]